MHMADALLSPAVGGTMWVASAALAGYSTKKLTGTLDQKKIPLMGVMGALVFAAQMINFSIPGTGSSGHIGGGLLLSAILGPYAGFLTMASVLTIQALFFADGGLLALGANIFNLGFFTAFVVYPLIYQKIVRDQHTRKRILSGALIATVVGLQLGAFFVVLETQISGKTELPFGTFVLLMQPIHLAIGIIEGLITTAVLLFLQKERPEILHAAQNRQALGALPIKKVLLKLLLLSALTGGILAWFASSNPDGLEWSLYKGAASSPELQTGSGNAIYRGLSAIQQKLSFLPGYGFAPGSNQDVQAPTAVNAAAGTSLSGIFGGLLTLILASLTGALLYLFKRHRKPNQSASGAEQDP